MPRNKAQAAKAVSKKRTKEQKEEAEDPSKAEKPSKTDVKKSEAQAEDDDNPKPEVQETNGEADDHDQSNKDKASISKKRKAPASSPRSSTKVARQGSRTTSRAAGSKSATTPNQILNFLLSSNALKYCYPEDELSSTKSKMKTYSKTSPANFTPFEHLLTASLLSKPLNHTLGMRSTRVLLNEPFSLNTPEKILEMGERQVLEALEAARTQHRQKTAMYVYQMAKTYKDSAKLHALRKMANDEGALGVVKQIQRDVKGMGPTGAELFCRRVQCVEGWGGVLWPFADGKSMEAVRALGLKVVDADELREMIEREINWDSFGDMGLDKVAKEVDMERRVQVEFVVILERAIGALLEGNVEQIRQAAAAGDS